MKNAYPRTIESGGGQRMTFIGCGRDANGEWAEVESVIAPGAGPMKHMHPYQVETLTVREGTLSYVTSDNVEHKLTAGQTATFPAGTAHRFWNSGSTPLRIGGRISPPMRFEESMTLLYGSMAANHGRPKLADAARLACEFADNAEMTGLPPIVRRVLLPIVWRISKLTGRYT